MVVPILRTGLIALVVLGRREMRSLLSVAVISQSATDLVLAERCRLAGFHGTDGSEKQHTRFDASGGSDLPAGTPRLTTDLLNVSARLVGPLRNPTRMILGSKNNGETEIFLVGRDRPCGPSWFQRNCLRAGVCNRRLQHHTGSRRMRRGRMFNGLW